MLERVEKQGMVFQVGSMVLDSKVIPLKVRLLPPEQAAEKVGHPTYSAQMGEVHRVEEAELLPLAAVVEPPALGAAVMGEVTKQEKMVRGKVQAVVVAAFTNPI